MNCNIVEIRHGIDSIGKNLVLLNFDHSFDIVSILMKPNRGNLVILLFCPYVDDFHR